MSIRSRIVGFFRALFPKTVRGNIPEQRPVEQPPLEQPEELPPAPPAPLREFIYTEEPTVVREDDNVFYVSPTSKTLGRWQAGTISAPAEVQDVESLLGMVPQNVPEYIFYFHGTTESLYPNKESNEIYLSLKIDSLTAQQAIDDPSLEFAADYVNLLESFVEGPQWINVDEISIVDRF